MLWLTIVFWGQSGAPIGALSHATLARLNEEMTLDTSRVDSWLFPYSQAALANEPIACNEDCYCFFQ